MTMKTDISPRLMYLMVSSGLRMLAYPEELGTAHWIMTPPAPAGQSDVVYLDNVRDNVLSKAWVVTGLDWDVLAPTWNGFAFTYHVSADGSDGQFEIRTS